MTKREFFTQVDTALRDGSWRPNPQLIPEMLDICENAIARLDKKNRRATEKRFDEDPLYDALLAVLPDEALPISDITAMIGEETTVGKVTYRLNRLVKEGLRVKEDIILPPTELSKARRVKGYRKNDNDSFEI